MPIWVKIIVFIIALGPIEWLMVRLWAVSHIEEATMEKYPLWIQILSLLMMLDIILLIPVTFWVIFLR